MINYLKLMRVHHYIKNGFIFVPLFFSGHFFDVNLLLKISISFIAFCFVVSAIYIINDLQDVEQDRLHPTKCKRPLAANVIKIYQAKVLLCFLFIIAFTILFLLNINYLVWIAIGTYFILNILYSNGLKNLPIIDIAILVSGFLLRILYGAAVCNIEISNWLYLTVLSMSFYLGLGKRRNELLKQKNNTNTRKVLKYYTHNFLDKNMYVALGLMITFYALWTVDPITTERLSNNALVWTVPLLIIIFMKYSLNIEGDSDGDPVEVIIKDKILLGLITSFVLLTAGMIYVF